MTRYISDPLWYKNISKGQIWNRIDKRGKMVVPWIKIISIINFKHKKAVKIEKSDGKRTTVEPGWIFYHYKKGE